MKNVLERFAQVSIRPTLGFLTPWLFLGCLLILAGSSPSYAQEYYFTHAPGVTETKQLSHRAGQTVFLSTQYNPSTGRFLWEMAFAPSASTGWLPNGLYMVVNNGFFPKGRQGESAMLFFDATDDQNPRLTTYAYNGNNAGNSWAIGDFGGSAPPDKILSSLTDSSWINKLSVTNQPGLRTFTIDINVAKINTHAPIYPSLRWYGLQFDQFIGIWSHPVANMKTAYGADGFLTKRTGNEGYVDIARELTAGCDGLTGSNKQLDACGVCGGDGSTCTGNNPSCVDGDPACPAGGTKCESLDVRNSIFILDSRAAQLRNLVLSAADTLDRRTGRKDKAIRKLTRDSRKKARALYISGWSAAWSIPTQILSCSGAIQCLSVDVSSKTTSYQKSVDGLVSIIKKLSKKLQSVSMRRTASFRKTLGKKTNVAKSTIQAEIATLPKTNQTC